MATTLRQGVRRYTCLVPVVVQIGGDHVTYEHVHILPVTRRIERDWQDGQINGPYGALEALIDRLTYEPYYVIEEMQHPDVELFNREFLTHLPLSISRPIANGEIPLPAAPDPVDYSPGDGGGPTGWPDAPPPAPRPPPPIPRDPRLVSAEPSYVGPDGPRPDMPDANFDLAQSGPDEPIGDIAMQERRAAAAAAFQDRTKPPGDGRELARDLAAEQSAPAQPASSVDRAARRAAADPVHGRDGRAPVNPEWSPTPRDPFDPRPRPAPVSRNRPPTVKPGAVPPAPIHPDDVSLAAAIPGRNPMIVKDQRTGREAIFDPGPDYVPDMSTAGYEPSGGKATNAFGLGDVEP